MFYDAAGDYSAPYTPEERKIHKKYMEESVKAKSYGEEHWAKHRRDEALDKLPSYQRSK